MRSAIVTKNPFELVSQPLAVRTPALERLLAELDHLSAAPDLEKLMRVVAGVEITLADVSSFVCFADDDYCDTPVWVCERFEVLCMGWQSGQHSTVHHHRGSCCCVRVLSGVLTQTEFARGPSGDLRVLRTGDVATGGLFGLQDLQIHRLANKQPAGQESVSLHVYAPPLLDAESRQVLPGTQTTPGI